jgi:hypothetical protein
MNPIRHAAVKWFDRQEGGESSHEHGKLSRKQIRRTNMASGRFRQSLMAPRKLRVSRFKQSQGLVQLLGALGFGANWIREYLTVVRGNLHHKWKCHAIE